MVTWEKVIMDSKEYNDFKKFIIKEVYPKYGKQPTLFRAWDKQALRYLYIDYLIPHYHYLRNNPKLFQVIREVQQHLEME